MMSFRSEEYVDLRSDRYARVFTPRVAAGPQDRVYVSRIRAACARYVLVIPFTRTAERGWNMPRPMLASTMSVK